MGSESRTCSACQTKLKRGEVRCPDCGHRNDVTMTLDQTKAYLEKAKKFLEENDEEKA